MIFWMLWLYVAGGCLMKVHVSTLAEADNWPISTFGFATCIAVWPLVISAAVIETLVDQLKGS